MEERAVHPPPPQSVPAQCGQRARRGAVAPRWRQRAGSGRAGGAPAFPFPLSAAKGGGVAGGSGSPCPGSPAGLNRAEAEGQRAGSKDRPPSHPGPGEKRSIYGN